MVLTAHALSHNVIETLGGRQERGNNTDVDFKAQTSGLLLYFPQTHDLLKDLAPSATVANHLKQRNDRLSQEGKPFWGNCVDLVI